MVREPLATDCISFKKTKIYSIFNNLRTTNYDYGNDFYWQQYKFITVLDIIFQPSWALSDSAMKYFQTILEDTLRISDNIGQMLLELKYSVRQ